MELSRNIKSLEASTTVAIADKARKLISEGHDVIDLNIGDPELATPAHICMAASQAMQAGRTHYVTSQGILDLRNAVAKKLKQENNINADPVDEILITPGGKTALYIALLTCLNPGDEVIYFEPAWVSIKPMIEMIGAIPVVVSLDYRKDYDIDVEDVRSKVTKRTKAIIINSPNNPTGKVISVTQLKVLAQIIRDKELYLISDEVYERITFGGLTFVSPASLPELEGFVMTVNGFSKSYAMAGWRLGYLIGPRRVMKEAVKAAQHSYTCVAPFIQLGGLEALENSQDFLYGMIQNYQKRHNYMVDALNKIEGAECAAADGTFFLFPRFDYKKMKSDELAKFLLDEALVVTTPGIAFGSAGEYHLRISLTADMVVLKKAVARMKAALQ
jgi:aspartate aminotransferase